MGPVREGGRAWHALSHLSQPGARPTGTAPDQARLPTHRDITGQRTLYMHPPSSLPLLPYLLGSTWTSHCSNSSDEESSVVGVA